MSEQVQENLSQPKMVIHRLLSGFQCSNREDCPCVPERVETDERIYWIHRPFVDRFGASAQPLNEIAGLVGVKQ